MILFRLQNVNSRTPYELDLYRFAPNYGRVIRNMRESHDVNRLLFYNDLDLKLMDRYLTMRDKEDVRFHFFTSPDLINKWFGHWMEFLLTNGFRIMQFDIPEDKVIVNNGGHACVSAKAC